MRAHFKDTFNNVMCLKILRHFYFLQCSNAKEMFTF